MVYIVCVDVIGDDGYEFDIVGVFSTFDRARDYMKQLKRGDWGHIEMWTIDDPRYHKTYAETEPLR
jgi:hypothetical protein